MRELTSAEIAAIDEITTAIKARLGEIGYPATVYTKPESGEVVIGVTEPADEIELTVVVSLAE